MRSELPIPEDEKGPGPANLYLWTAEELGLSRSEIMWAISCFISTQQADEGPEDDLVGPIECEGCPSCTGEEPEEHGSIDADVIHDYVLSRILSRIEAEPDLVQRSILAIRKDGELTPEIVAELGPLESDPLIVRQVNKLSQATVTTMDDIEPETFRLAILYLIHRIYIGGPSLPLDEQVQIIWRIPKPESTPFKGKDPTMAHVHTRSAPLGAESRTPDHG